jgi:hypothetical protein
MPVATVRRRGTGNPEPRPAGKVPVAEADRTYRPSRYFTRPATIVATALPWSVQP